MVVVERGIISRDVAQKKDFSLFVVAADRGEDPEVCTEDVGESSDGSSSNSNGDRQSVCLLTGTAANS